MKTIQEQVNEALSGKLPYATKSTLKLLKAEFQREATKEISDKQAVVIIHRLIKGNTEMIGYVKDEVAKKELYVSNVTLSMLLPEEEQRPEQATDDEIKDYIKQNINFADFKSPMQAMKPIMKHFGKSVDGNKVKEILKGDT